MENKQPKAKIMILYFCLYRLMDLESLFWDIADIIIKPTSLLRRWVAYRISLLVEIKKQ